MCKITTGFSLNQWLVPGYLSRYDGTHDFFHIQGYRGILFSDYWVYFVVLLKFYILRKFLLALKAWGVLHFRDLILESGKQDVC